MSFNYSPENCDYRGEGNTALVIALNKEEKILRLIKHENIVKEYKSSAQRLQEMQNEILMIKNVMKPLLGNYLVNCPVIVHIEAKDIKLLNSIVSAKRPCSRKHKQIREEDCHGLLLPDYCTLPPDLKLYPSAGPVLSIEIKPKPGWLFKESFLVPSICERSVLMCHFCRKQVYKMKVNGVLPKSSYCPTDLFSGCPVRMLHALKLLVQVPQNNIRIFKDGILAFSHEKQNNLENVLSEFFDNCNSNSLDMLCTLIIKVLLKPFPPKPTDIQIQPPDQCDILKCANAHHGCNQKGDCHSLPFDSVLHRILSVQMLDKIDIQKTYSLYKDIKNDQKPDYIGCYSRSEIPPYLGKKEQAIDESYCQYASRKVWEFIVSLVAKDCSIMLVLKSYTGNKKVENPNLITNDDGKSYLFSMAVADLDTKPLSRIEKHYLRTPDWLQACLSMPV